MRNRQKETRAAWKYATGGTCDLLVDLNNELIDAGFRIQEASFTVTKKLAAFQRPLACVVATL